MAAHTVLIPTYIGHLGPVTTLAGTIREYCGDRVGIVLVIGETDRPAFEKLAAACSCRVLTIEDLVADYTGQRVDAARLLTLVSRFRFQALKKLLGVASLEGEVLIMDSESLVTRDLTPLFEGGIADTTVVYSERPWKAMKESLTTEVHDECDLLLEPQPYWFFESFNWLYSSDLVRELMRHLLAKHGKEWVFRPKPLFECQLYFQYAYARGAGYRYLTAQDVLTIHFGAERAGKLLRAFYGSPLQSFGIFEYLARFVSRRDYVAFIGNPEVLRHFRLTRHEPYVFHDIVGEVRAAAGGDPNYFGEASMHRRPLLNGRIAVIASGRFHQEEDAHNLRHFLRGVECDLFLGIGADAWPDATAEEILQPCRVARVDDGEALEGRRLALRSAPGLPEKDGKPDRDVGSMAMFDKMAAGWRALLEQEAVRGKRYAVVVRTRPDIFAAHGLHEILWEVAENMGSLQGCVMLPDTFWSQGVNDQLFLGLREEMGRLFEGLDGAAYARSDFRNPEYFLGRHLRGAGLAPVPFPYEYILTRGEQPELSEVQGRLDGQEKHFWSSKVELPPWKDAGKALDAALENVLIKNGRMKPTVVRMPDGVAADLVFAREANGRTCVLLSEHKSPAVFLRRQPGWAGALTPQALATGVLRPGKGQAARLEMFDEASGRLELSLGAGQRVSLQVVPPPGSTVLVSLAEKSFGVLGGALRQGRTRLGTLRRRSLDLMRRWKLARPVKKRGVR